MMCHLDETSCSRYNATAHFGTGGLLQRPPRAFWSGRGVRGGGGG